MRPRLFVENFYSSTQFRAHVVSASSEATDYQAWRVGTGRRSRGDRWMPATTNTWAEIEVDCAAAPAADMIAIDRGHNLSGQTVILQRSADGVGWTDVLSIVVPAAAGGDLGAGNGVLTEEGAWLRTFAAQSYRYWRLRVAPMGVGIRPEIVGIWLGTSWSPLEYFDLPYSPGALRLVGAESESDAGWVGASPLARGRRGDIVLKLHSHDEYEDARYHIEQHFWRRRPMWIVFDTAVAERAVLAVPRLGEHGFEVSTGWAYPQASLSWVEHEPLRS